MWTRSRSACARKDVDELVRHRLPDLPAAFGGINLEDIAAPRCFEIERKLKEICDIPIFHDDQHGTAVVMLAALTECAASSSGRQMEDVKVVISRRGQRRATAIGEAACLNAGVEELYHG